MEPNAQNVWPDLDYPLMQPKEIAKFVIKLIAQNAQKPDLMKKYAHSALLVSEFINIKPQELPPKVLNVKDVKNFVWDVKLIEKSVLLAIMDIIFQKEYAKRLEKDVLHILKMEPAVYVNGHTD